jgi:hypothetical protein
LTTTLHDYLDAFADDDRFSTVEQKEDFDAQTAAQERKDEEREAQTARNETLGFDSVGEGRRPEQIFVNADPNTVHYQGFSIPLTPKEISDGILEVYETGNFIDPRYGRTGVTDAGSEYFDETPLEIFDPPFFNSNISGQKVVESFLSRYMFGTASEGHAAGVRAGEYYQVPITYSTAFRQHNRHLAPTKRIWLS